MPPLCITPQFLRLIFYLTTWLGRGIMVTWVCVLWMLLTTYFIFLLCLFLWNFTTTYLTITRHGSRGNNVVKSVKVKIKCSKECQNTLKNSKKCIVMAIRDVEVASSHSEGITERSGVTLSPRPYRVFITKLSFCYEHSISF